jgi:DNA-directed RNA polymerase specialized sigma24 family protein
MLAEVNKLPVPQPKFLQMHMQGYNYLEIAGRLGYPSAFVHRELARAYASLRLQMPPSRFRKSRRIGKLRTFAIAFLMGGPK